MTSSPSPEPSPKADSGIRPILLFFIVSPVIVACLETLLQYSVAPESDLTMSLAFAMLFTLPGTFFAWLMTTLVARLPGAGKLPMILLLMIGFIASLLVFRPYNVVVYDWVSRVTPRAHEMIYAEGGYVSQSVARFLFVNIPGVFIWTGLNLFFMMRFGFPVYGTPSEKTEPKSASGSPAFGQRDLSDLPDFCRAAGIEDIADLWVVSAEEHYLRLRGRFGTRMIRQPFGAAIDQIPKNCGLQVHRSHWIAFGRVARIETASGMQLVLADGTKIPVSSSYWNAVRLTETALLSA